VITASEALSLLENNGSMDISNELSMVEYHIREAIRKEEYSTLIDLENCTPVRRRKVLLTLSQMGYGKHHTGGNRWIISWY
jgi:hypothetical protein